MRTTLAFDLPPYPLHRENPPLRLLAGRVDLEENETPRADEGSSP